jgi:hypothetical protein
MWKIRLNKIRFIICRLVRDLFIADVFCFFLLLALEDFRPGFVYFWFDIKIVLYIATISGIIALFAPADDK